MHEHVHHEEQIGLVTLKIVPDLNPANPRRDWDNAATMACRHRRYDLGDKDGMDDLESAIRTSRYYSPCWDDLDGVDLIVIALPRCKDILALPLYLYDHSGISMSTSRGYPFNCPWDSGQVGVIFMDKTTVLREFGGTRLTPATKNRSFDLMVSEVTAYDQFLTGDVWGYVVEDAGGEHLDSCWGFYGVDYAIEEGKAAARHESARLQSEKDIAFAEEAEANRPDMYPPAVRHWPATPAAGSATHRA